MIGFNDHVAWSRTVSAGRRFGLFEPALDPQDPDGSVETVRCTRYRTRMLQ